MLIDWTKIALDIYDKIKAELINFDKKPTLWAILVWNNPESLRYIKQKKKWADYVWINFKLLELKEDISEKKLLEYINKVNKDNNISWYIIQLPLPKHINKNNIINSINSDKDIDWFHPINQWKMLIWDKTWFQSCTPMWIINILKSLDLVFLGKVVCVIGRSNIVWKPVIALLINEWATVICCNSSTQNIKEFTKKADIIIIATWKPKLLKEDMLKKWSIIIDVWFSVIDGKIIWDADTENIDKAWHKITPVPGWVWPLTVAMLIKNTLKAYKKEKL